MPNLAQARNNHDLVADPFVVKTAAATLTVRETRVQADTTGGAFTLTLPSVVEAKGLTFSIIFLTDNGNLTIADADDSYNWTDEVFDNALDRTLLYSDGLVWWQIGLSEV